MPSNIHSKNRSYYLGLLDEVLRDSSSDIDNACIFGFFHNLCDLVNVFYLVYFKFQPFV